MVTPLTDHALGFAAVAFGYSDQLSSRENLRCRLEGKGLPGVRNRDIQGESSSIRFLGESQLDGDDSIVGGLVRQIACFPFDDQIPELCQECAPGAVFMLANLLFGHESQIAAFVDTHVLAVVRQDESLRRQTTQHLSHLLLRYLNLPCQFVMCNLIRDGQLQENR